MEIENVKIVGESPEEIREALMGDVSRLSVDIKTQIDEILGKTRELNSSEANGHLHWLKVNLNELMGEIEQGRLVREI